MNLRSLLYCLAGLLGDVNAVRRNKMPQRIVRKAVHRRVSGALSKALRW